MLKKSQLTIFIVFGIILVLTSVFMIFIFDIKLFETEKSKLENSVIKIVNDCSYDISKRGIFFLSLRGGFLEISREILVDPRKYVKMGDTIPLWDSSRNFYPTISSMENELEIFIEEDLTNCIRSNMIQFDNILEYELGDLAESDVEIFDEEILIRVNFPIRFWQVNSNEVIELETFSNTLEDEKLGKLYELSLKIYNKNSQEKFLEDLILDQILTASDYSKRESMPTEGLIFSCIPRVWTKAELKKNLARLNNLNFKFLQFENTYPKDEILNSLQNEEWKQYYRNFYTIDVDANRNNRDLDVEVLMPSVEITSNEGILQKYPFSKFEVSPSSGELVKPIDFKIESLKISAPCVQIYGHRYDLEYPLIVSIKDTKTSSFFQFPIKIQIENNYPKYDNTKIIDYVPNTLNVQTFCEEQNRNNLFQIFAYDALTNENLNGVNLTHKCLSNYCELGQTKVDSLYGVDLINYEPRLNTNLTFCVGGEIEARKEGYHSISKIIDSTNQDQLETVYLPLIKLKEYDLNQENFLFISQSSGHGVYPNEEKESIYVSFKNDKNNFEADAVFSSFSKQEELNKLNLLAGNFMYNFSLIYADENGELLGIFEVENMQINTKEGNKIKFIAPYTKDLDEENFLQFYGKMINKTLVGKYRVSLEN